MSNPPKVYIITWCRTPVQLYGSTLVFESVRTGFPDSEIVVVENASPPPLRAPIIEAARAADCTLDLMDEEDRHWALLEKITLQAEGPIVFLDPDIVLWERIDRWQFGDALMAGRVLPEFDDPFTGTLTLPRIHTSHLWFPDPKALQARIAVIQRKYYQVGSLFEPRMQPPGWWRWDAAATLYNALGAEAVGFTEAQLDGYDHLFCGSHLAMVASKLGDAWGGMMSASHQQAQSDWRSLKGIWREQEKFFTSRPWSGKLDASPGPSVS